MCEGTINAVCVSHRSGLPRPMVAEGDLREGLGFLGNRHSVGGDREVCLFSMETYADLVQQGVKAGPGSFGENLVISGIPFEELKVGDRLELGEGALVEITMVRQPCSNLKQVDERMPEFLIGRSGWMARVVQGGMVRPGDVARLIPGG